MFLQFSSKMEQAQSKFSSTYPTQDVNTARRLLQQHQDIKRSKFLIFFLCCYMIEMEWDYIFNVIHIQIFGVVVVVII